MRSVDELGAILSRMYEEASDGEKVAHIHLFGIQYAAAMGEAGVSAAQVIRESALPQSYQAEVSKGIKLAKYVAPLSRFAGSEVG